MKKSTVILILLAVAGISLLGWNGLRALRTLYHTPEPYTGDYTYPWQPPVPDSSKKTVLIVASNANTELFDLIAPFYLFHETGKANVYIVAEKRAPVHVKEMLYVLPQLSFAEVDSLRLTADVIVIPFLGVSDTLQDPVILQWIRQHHQDDTRVLSICDGAATAAATGLYDGKPMTCHATDFPNLTPHFSKPIWVQHVSFTQSGNLYSTAGVSNAAEGSLKVIEDLFGSETMQAVMEKIHYPSPSLKSAHRSAALEGAAKRQVLQKMFLTKNKKVGVLLQDGSSEFELASLIDTYSRTFPAKLIPVIRHGNSVKTQYGLTWIITDKAKQLKPDELHILEPDLLPAGGMETSGHTKVVTYENLNTQYPFDVWLERIEGQYGKRLAHVTRLALDYN